jgi:hypothetical protein
LNDEELAALVETRIAERDAKRELEAQRIYELYNPPPTPAPSRPEASPNSWPHLTRPSMPPMATWARRTDGSLGGLPRTSLGTLLIHSSTRCISSVVRAISGVC